MRNFKIIIVIISVIAIISILNYYGDKIENEKISLEEGLDIANNDNEEQGKDDEKENDDIQNSIDNNGNDNEINVDNVDDNISVEISTSTLSNKTYAWGFRRMKDGVQPEFTAAYIKPLNDYDGIYVGNKEDLVMYLTFDEGYENGYTPTILDTLLEKDIKATFFVTMPYVKQNPELIQRMIDEGHIIGNHTVNHPSMPSITDDEKLKKEIMDLHNYMVDNFNYEMVFLRPPKGEYSERTVKISRDLGYSTVLWSFAYDDWDVNKQKGVDYAKSMIYNNLHNGCVMLLHAVSKDNTEVLGDVIDEIRERGIEIVPLDEFVR